MASDPFTFHEGERPLLISVPHDGRKLAPGMAGRLTEAGSALADTDWHVSRLYEPAKRLGASMLVANYSRYVADLNRPADDTALYAGQVSTGLCPTETFAGEPIYRDAAGLLAAEIADRRETYWQPYHRQIAATLDSMRERFGYALLWDAHSIASVVPRLFAGELKLLNLGSHDRLSASGVFIDGVVEAAGRASLAMTVDGRFKGGYITRHYGRPAQNIHALQLEIAQRAYMDEPTGHYRRSRAGRLWDVIERMLRAWLDTARREYG